MDYNMNVFLFGAWAFLIILATSLVYLIGKAKNFRQRLKWLIMVIAFLVLYLFNFYWVRDYFDSKVLIINALLIAVSIILGICIIGLALFSSIKNVIKISAAIFGKKAEKPYYLIIINLLLALLPLSSTGFLAFNYHKMTTNPPVSIKYEFVNINGSRIAFRNNQAIDFYGHLWWKTIKSGVLDKPEKLSVGKREILFLPGFGDDRSYRTEFYPNQTVHQGLLGEAAVFKIADREIKLARNSAAEFYANGAPASGELAEDLKWLIGKLRLHLLLPRGAQVSFYRNGALKSFPLSGDLTVTYKGVAIPLQKAQNSLQYTKLYPDGSLRKCYLGRDTKLPIGKRQVLFKAGEELTFYNDGSLRSGTLAEDAAVSLGEKHTTAYRDMEVMFYPDGKLKMTRYYLNKYVYTKTGEVFCQKESGDEYFRMMRKTQSAATRVFGRELWEDECQKILAANRIEIDPDFEDPGILIMFDDGKRSGLKVKKVLFIEPVTVRINNKVVHCKPFEWVKI